MVRRRALLSGQGSGARKSNTTTIPSPIGGWNARDSFAEMRINDAVEMTNWFPRQSDVIMRPGYTQHCDTTEAATVQQIIPFDNGSNADLLACVNGKIIDVTTSSPSTLGTGYSSNDWSFDYLGNLVFLANGADTVKSYNGTAIATPAFTGVTTSTLDHVSAYKSRLYFVEKDTQSMWYGGTGAVTGALTEFDFSTVSNIEGNLCFTSHLKGDGGDGGVDDVFVAVFKGGDVLAYSGSDPGDATNWSLIGHYKIGRPLSRLGYQRNSEEVYVVTDRGYEALGQMMRYGERYTTADLHSSRIQRTVIRLIDSIGASDDWRIFTYPKGQMQIITVPDTGDSRVQHVLNYNTGAWCNFSNLVFYSWGLLQGNAYAGGKAGVVYQFDGGATADAGTAIQADCQQAWTTMRAPGYTKHIQLVKPHLFASAQPSISINAGSDFNNIPLTSFTSAGSADSSTWDGGDNWDSATWASGDTAFEQWYGRNALGNYIGWRLAVESSSDQVRWNAVTLIYQTGGIV